MYTKIVVAVDGSETSNLALREAVKLAKGQRAQLSRTCLRRSTTLPGSRDATFQSVTYKPNQGVRVPT